MIPVSKPYMPKLRHLNQYIEKIYETNQLTNGGPLISLLQERLSDYLGVKNLLLVANGTLALEVAFLALGISAKRESQFITTPFTFAATTSAIQRHGVTPVYSDISKKTLCLDKNQIVSKITTETKAIVPVHVYGSACEVQAIGKIASDHGLRVIYDAAHAFGVKDSANRSILEHGDASTLSFHATKLFHTVEGGAIVFKEEAAYREAQSIINFGLTNGMPERIGLNAKLNEFQAAVGLAVLDDIKTIIEQREVIVARYDNGLDNRFERVSYNDDYSRNYSYYPIILPTEQRALEVISNLNDSGIFARRYFYPSLDTIWQKPFKDDCPVSNDISKRVVCLPLYPGLMENEVNQIIEIVSTVES